MRAWLVHLEALWRTVPERMALELLRVGMGIIWALNLVFVLDPENSYFATFRSTALSYAPTTYGGVGFPDWVAAHPTFFAGLVALLTLYLAVAFLCGLTTRLACFVGAGFSVALLITQLGSTFYFPGGTDVGPHPLYLLIYAVLFLGGAGRYVALDHWIWVTRRARLPRISRWLASPRE